MYVGHFDANCALNHIRIAPIMMLIWYHNCNDEHVSAGEVKIRNPSKIRAYRSIELEKCHVLPRFPTKYHKNPLEKDKKMTF